MDTHCPSCGTEVKDKLPKCSSCGTIQDTFFYKSRVAAAALACFAGIFGGHRFYLGQWWGIFYLLFFWTYIPCLIGLIEGIVFLTTSQKSWNEKYNQGVSAGSEKGTVVMVFACMLPVIAVIGVLAAVAIPAYQDYAERARFASAYNSALVVQNKATDYIVDNDSWPASLSMLGYENDELVDEVNDFQIGIYDNGVVGAKVGVNSAGEDKYIVLEPVVDEGELSWKCYGENVLVKYLPKICR